MKLFYRTTGSGPPLIILHGLFGMSDNWLTIAQKIGQKHTVYLPDHRNHGRSPHSDNFGYNEMVTDLNAFIQEHKLTSLKLIGHSMGGKVAMLYALMYPEQISKLVVVDIAPRKYDTTFFKSLLEQLKSIDISHIKNYTEANKILSGNNINPLIRQFLLKNLYRDDAQNFKWRININSIYHNLNEITDGNSFTGSYDDDSLFIRGGKSDYILESDYDKIYRHFPNAMIQSIPSASHWVHADAPDAFCDILKDFL